ncbi:MAG: deoxyribonuclease IV [Chloroflexota bacterium]|nr:deoxyribonuclease IV [Chloroflexota bacterium]
MRLGAHVSTSGGLDKVSERAMDIGAEVVQIFATSPRAWKFRDLPESQIQAFRKNAVNTGLQQTFIHASYLINVGGDSSLLQKSIDSLTLHMDAAGKIGAEGVIFHGGSHKGIGFDGVIDQASSALRTVLENSPREVNLIIENSAGMGSHIGSSFVEIARLIDLIGDSRVKVCLDTEHTFAAGYNLADANSIDEVMGEFDKEIGLEKLTVVHANDAKVEFGSGVDRHENIGDGYIGIDGFRIIMGHSAFREVPFILEVPGIDGNGPDQINMDRLKAIRSELSI